MSETLNLLYFRGNSQLIKKSILESITEGYVVKIECDTDTFKQMLIKDKYLSDFFTSLIEKGLLVLEIKTTKPREVQKMFLGMNAFGDEFYI